MLTTIAGAIEPTLLLLLKATLLLGAGFGLSLLLQRASAGTRHLVWLATLATLLMMPALAAWAPWRLEILPAPAAVVATTTPETRAVVEAPVDEVASDVAAMPTVGASNLAPSSAAPAATPASLVSFFSSLSLGATLLLVYGVVALAIVGWLARGALAVRRIVRGARPLDTPEWRMPLWEVADRLELPEVPRLLVSDEARMPFACGLRHPTVVFPRSCESWSLDRRQAVLLHELAHVKRRDLLGHTLGRLACALWWFHPLMWTAAKRLRAESERACDDLALSCGARASDYAEHLLDIVASVRGDATPSVAMAMARRREFEGRMLAILDPRMRRAAPSRRQAVSVVASVAMLAVLVGAAAPAPRAAATEDAPVSLAQRPTLDPETPAAPAAPVRGAAAPAPRSDEAPARDLAVVSAADDESAKARPSPKAQPKAEAAPDVEDKIAAKQAEKALEQAAAPKKPDGYSAKHHLMDDLIAKKGARTDDERARLLANVLTTDTSASLRRVAAWGLAQHAGASEAAPALSNAVRKDADADVREMAAWALASVYRAPGISDALTAALRDPNARVRATAAWALASIGDGDAVEALAGALGDSSASVRYRAAWAIGTLGPRTAPPRLVALLKDSDPKVRRVTAWSLFVIADPATADALDQAFRAEKDRDAQLAYVRAMAAMGDRSVEPIKRLLESTDPEIRNMAVRALAGGRVSGPWPWPMPMPRPYP